MRQIVRGSVIDWTAIVEPYRPWSDERKEQARVSRMSRRYSTISGMILAQEAEVGRMKRELELAEAVLLGMRMMVPTQTAVV